MPLTEPTPNIGEENIETFNAVAGTPTGSRVTVASPVRGWFQTVGFASIAW